MEDNSNNQGCLENELKKYKEITNFIKQTVNYYDNWTRDSELLRRYFAEEIYIMKNNQLLNFKQNQPLYNFNFKTGQVFKFHFGVNIVPEMSLNHMGIIISKHNSYLYVLPIMSYKEEYKNAYHPIDNRANFNKDYYLLKKDEFPFLEHNSILKLVDLRCISTKRAIQFIDKIDVTSEFFDYIMNMAYNSIFPTISYENNKEIHELKLQIEKSNNS